MRLEQHYIKCWWHICHWNDSWFHSSVSVAENTVCQCQPFPFPVKALYNVLTAALGVLLAAPPPSLSIHRKRKHAPVCATANEGNAALQLCYVVFACTSAVLTDVQTWHECTQSRARITNRGKLEKRFVIGGSSFMCVLTLAKKLQVSTPWMYTKVRQLEFLLSFDQFKLPHTHKGTLHTLSRCMLLLGTHLLAICG